MSREMKDSGIEWIGEIPKDWKICRIKNIFNRKNSKAKQDNPVILSLARSGVKIRDISTNEGQIAESYYSYNPVETFDLLINPMDLYSGANCSCSKVSGVISPAYINIRAKSGVNPFYYDYYLKTQYWSKALFAHGKGVSFDNRWTLSVDTFMNYYAPFPTFREQNFIAEFLRDKCGCIEDIQEKTKSSIEELKRIKQSMVTTLITKGVREAKLLKRCGDEKWGMIPQNWTFASVKTCIDSVKSGLSAVSEDDTAIESGYYVLRTSSVSSGIFLPTEVKPVLSTFINRLICPVEKDTLIVSRMNTDQMVGICAYVDKDYPNLFLPDKLWKIKVKNNIYPKFLWYSINSAPAHAWFTEISTGASASMQNITIKDFTGNHIPIPPLEEQKEIVAYLDIKCGEIDKLIKIKEQYLIELENYKKSLIYEYVTGKKEVPNNE